jgi:hypothetical protein
MAPAVGQLAKVRRDARVLQAASNPRLGDKATQQGRTVAVAIQ